MSYITEDFFTQQELEKETWKKIPGFSLYSVSTLGRIRNDNTGKLLSQKIHISGYIRVSLLDDDKIKKNYTFHQLVALTFIPNPENKETIDHKNRIRHDNRVSNLEWASHQEQSENKKKIGLNHRGKVVECYDLNNNLLHTFLSIAEGLRFLQQDHNINCHDGIIRCCKGRTKTYNGYI